MTGYLTEIISITILNLIQLIIATSVLAAFYIGRR